MPDLPAMNACSLAAARRRWWSHSHSRWRCWPMEMLAEFEWE
jgi:hypothetical protein